MNLRRARKYHVEITRTAEHDVSSIFRYIAADNPRAATEWLEEIGRQIDSLEMWPNRCPVIPESGELEREYRHYLYGNYRTVFRVQGAKVIIMRVIHGARLLDPGMLAE